MTDHLLLLFAGLMTGVNGLIAVLLSIPPNTAENYPVLVRGRGTGLVAAHAIWVA